MARDATIFPQAIGVASTWQPELMTALADAVRVADAGDRRPPGTLAGARRLPRPPVGPDRGDVRRGPVPRRPHGGCLRPRPPGRRPRDRGGGDRQALRRLRRVGGRAQLGAVAHRSARAPRGLPPSVRGGRPCRRPALGDARLRRARRRSGGGRPRAAHAASCASNGGSPAASWPTTSPSASSPTTTDSPSMPRTPRRWRLAAGLDVELPGTDCYGAPLLDAVRSGRVAPEAARHSGRPGAHHASSSSGCSSSPSSTPMTRSPPPTRRAHRELAGEIARKSLVLLRNDGTLPLRPDVTDRPDRAQRRRGAQPPRRLHLRGPRRVAAGDAAPRQQRVRHPDRRQPRPRAGRAGGSLDRRGVDGSPRRARAAYARDATSTARRVPASPTPWPSPPAATSPSW